MNQKIRITTRKGDTGKTRLFSNEEVSKSDLRLRAYGGIDELVSLLGVAVQLVEKAWIRDDLILLQKEMFIVGSELATTIEHHDRLKRRVDDQFIVEFEERVESLFEITEIPNDFILPGSSQASSFLDLARAVSRRVERDVVLLFDNNEVENLNILIWINRLSDYLYLLARQEDDNPLLLNS